MKGKANFIGLFLLCFTFSSFSQVELPQQWLKLMRYNKTLFGYESEVDYPKYFLAENGKNDPVSEMQASVKAFARPFSDFKDVNKHPVCLFPGRYIYLLKLGKVEKAVNIDECVDFKVFKKKLELSSVSIIFSSYYINRPASAFGHTFLKLNKEDPLKSDLNSYGVDFSAQVTTKNPLAYGVMGIFGGFYGRFSLLPYFLKLREYNDFESRDLWEFEIDLTKDELDLFVAHLWDMNLALFEYYYFTENCSYHIHRFVDAVKPEWKLWEFMYYFTVPIDTLIPLVKDEKIVKGIYYRPSLYKRSLDRLKNLTKKQKKIIKKSIESKKLSSLKNFKKKEKVQILDSIMDFTDYKFSKEIYLLASNKAKKIQNFKREVLIERSQIFLKSKKRNKSQKNTFEYAHQPRKISFGHRNFKEDGIVFRHRYALHNILEPEGDIYSNFSLEMGTLSIFSSFEEKKIIIEEYEIAHVEALRPFNYFEKKVSWNFDFGFRTVQATVAPYFNVGIGPSFELSSHIFSFFIQSDNEHLFKERRLQKNYIGPHFQWLYRLNRFGVKASYRIYSDPIDKESNIEFISGTLNYNHSRLFQTNIDFSRIGKDSQTSFFISMYY